MGCVAENQQKPATVVRKGEKCASHAYVASMARIVSFSLSLVAFSAGAGFGLSSIHKASMDGNVAHLEQPGFSAPAASGFALPEYVPVRVQPAQEAPVAPVQEAIVDPAPIIDQTPAPAVTQPTQKAAPVATATVPAPRPQPVVRTIEAPQPAYDPSRYKATVAKPQYQFVDRATGGPRPSYVVGVYR